MGEQIQAPFVNAVAQLCSNQVSDILKLNTGSVIVVPERIRSLATAIVSGSNNTNTIVVITPTHSEADALSGDLKAFINPSDVELLPAWETLPFERVSPSIETMGHRTRVLSKMTNENPPKVIVASIRAIIQKTIQTKFHSINIKVGDEIDRDSLIAQLIDIGYSREYQVESRGECSVRGSIVDIYPSTENHPIRIELWGDTIERISNFSVANQRSTKQIDNVEIYPAREVFPNENIKEKANKAQKEHAWASESFREIADGNIFDGIESFLPFLTDDTQGFLGILKSNDSVILCDPSSITSRIDELKQEEDSLVKTLSITWDAPVSDSPSLFIDFDEIIKTIDKRSIWLSIPSSPDDLALSCVAFDSPRGDIEELSKRLTKLRDDDMCVVLVSPTITGVRRICEQLGEYSLDVTQLDSLNREQVSNKGIYATVAEVDKGFISHDYALAILPDHELAGHRHVRRRQSGSRRSITTYDDLTSGDYIVHHQHGVGVFDGLETKTMMGVSREYLVLSFKGSDKLFVPSDQVGLVRKYVGSDKPKLHRLGGSDFDKVRRSAKAHVNLIAQELIVLYRKRLHAKGHSFAQDNVWQKEMEDLFEYELTIDQKKAIEDVKADMEQLHPMDRLICGDVGFGKTEVALRAAFKAVQDSKQVAILVPTTLLATQHGYTFNKRFNPFGLKVEVLSRFKTPKEQKEIIDGLSTGSIDVVIGTHRLLSADVKFKDLGLLVVDEEQRFGVTHKEAIKQFTTDIDVLTLSATPIPRTLEMSLTGIRDLSMITTPPADRQPILTYVNEYDERAVAEAIRRELLREGQVFYIHNRVKDLEHIADRVHYLVPEARIVIAHGQMAESKLEKIVDDFYDHKYDVLIATTIVESGLDLPSVNTLIVDRADALGLAQLYQLRGRVGRRGQRAYAYLFSPYNKALSHEAYERLKTIGEFNELGSGFKIAMRDLELRGAGSLLGDVQSGHVGAIGFDLYCEMVNDAINELNGVEPEEKHEVTIDLSINALLSEDYITKQEYRFDIYRRLSQVNAHQDVANIEEELKDRFGPLDQDATNLIKMTHLRITCSKVGISSIVTSRDKLRLVGVELLQSQQVRLKRLYPNSIYKSSHALGPSEIVVTNSSDKSDILFIEELIAELFDDSELA